MKIKKSSKIRKYQKTLIFTFAYCLGASAKSFFNREDWALVCLSGQFGYIPDVSLFPNILSSSLLGTREATHV